MTTEDKPWPERYGETAACGLLLVLRGVLRVLAVPFAVLFFVATAPFYVIGRMFPEKTDGKP